MDRAGGRAPRAPPRAPDFFDPAGMFSAVQEAMEGLGRPAPRAGAGAGAGGGRAGVPDLAGILGGASAALGAIFSDLGDPLEGAHEDREPGPRPRPSGAPQGRAEAGAKDLGVYGGCPFETWTVRDLKRFLGDVEAAANCVEKHELVALCRQKVNWPLPASTDNEDLACRICVDRELDAVMIPCGHQLCSVCSYGLESCPMCRAPVERRIRTYR